MDIRKNTMNTNHNFEFDKSKATHSIIPAKYPARKNIPFFDTCREICDNSIDAKATTINIVLEKNQIFFIDNGKGMNKEDLNYSLVSGRSGKTTKSDTLGKFGVGLNQSIAQFNKDADIAQAHFLSLTWDNNYDKPTYSYIKISPEEINKNLSKDAIEGWKIQPSVDLFQTQKNDIQNYLMQLCSKYIWNEGPFQSGTIVGIIEASIPELKSKNFEAISKELSCHLGTSYYNLLKDKKLKINILYQKNNIKHITPVLPIDLLLRNEKDVETFFYKEYQHSKCTSTLKVHIIVTPKDRKFQKPKDDELTKNSPYYINNDNNGIALQHNGVIICRGIKRIPISNSLADKIRAIQKDNNISSNGKLRDYIWWNSNDSYSSPIRVLLEIDSQWHINKLIQLDQEKTSFEFHEDIENILADIYIELNKAYNYSTDDKNPTDKKPINPPITQTSTPTPTPTKTTSSNPPIKTYAPPTTKTTSPPTPQLTTIKKTSPDREEWIKLSHEIARSYNEEIRSQLFDFSQKLYNKIYID